MCYIRHYNKFSNWYHFTRLQTQEVLFRSPVASSTTVCWTQPAKTSITRCFSLSTSFTGSGIHATVHSPKCFSCVVLCMIALCWLKIMSLTLQTFAAVRAFLCVPLYRSRLDLSQFSLIRLKIIQNCFYIFFQREIHDHSLASVTLKFFT